MKCELRRHRGPLSRGALLASLLTFTKKTMSYDDKCVSRFCNAGWGEVLTHMSPYGYANFGIAFGLGLSVVGAAWGIWLTGSSLVGAAVKAPRIRSKNLIRYEFTCILRAMIAKWTTLWLWSAISRFTCHDGNESCELRSTSIVNNENACNRCTSDTNLRTHHCSLHQPVSFSAKRRLFTE